MHNLMILQFHRRHYSVAKEPFDCTKIIFILQQNIWFLSELTSLPSADPVGLRVTRSCFITYTLSFYCRNYGTRKPRNIYIYWTTCIYDQSQMHWKARQLTYKYEINVIYYCWRLRRGSLILQIASRKFA